MALPTGPKKPHAEIASARSEPLVAGSEPPVVARLMVEIRSDGSYTVARGAMEDHLSGEKVAIEARGSTPLALALELARSIAKAPWLARGALRTIVGKRLAGRK